MVIGLTGSIAMGKSEAARYLASLDFPVFDSDVEVHRLYDTEQGAALIENANFSEQRHAFVVIVRQ